jgi:hypothetical protein
MLDVSVSCSITNPGGSKPPLPLLLPDQLSRASPCLSSSTSIGDLIPIPKQGRGNPTSQCRTE